MSYLIIFGQHMYGRGLTLQNSRLIHNISFCDRVVLVFSRSHQLSVTKWPWEPGCGSFQQIVIVSAMSYCYPYFTSFFWLFFPTRCWNLGKGTWFSAWPSLYQQDCTCTRCLMVRVLHARLLCYCCILIPAAIKDSIYQPSWRWVLLNTLPAQTHVI